MADFIIADVLLPGKLNALVKNIMNHLGETDPNEAVRLVNANLVTFERVTPKYTEEDGVITFDVTSTGRTGEEWIVWLEANGHKVSGYAKELLLSSDFKSTNGVTYTIKVLKGELFADKDRITENIRVDAPKRNLTTPSAEVACLIREKFSNVELESMGLFAIITMHEPINDSDGGPDLLGAGRLDGDSWLSAYYDDPDGRWGCDDGFAFVSSQESA